MSQMSQEEQLEEAAHRREATSVNVLKTTSWGDEIFFFFGINSTNELIMNDTIIACISQSINLRQAVTLRVYKT